VLLPVVVLVLVFFLVLILTISQKEDYQLTAFNHDFINRAKNT
jgi:hypothetical protein